MTTTHAATTDPPTTSPVRLWPAVVLLAVQAGCLVVTVLPQVDNALRFYVMLLGPIACGLLFLGWLLLASRLRWPERAVILLGSAALAAAAVPLVHASVLPIMFIYGVPLAMLLLAVGLGLGRRRPPAVRSAFALALVAVGWALFGLGRMEGFDGSYRPELAWRWTVSAEESNESRRAGAESRRAEAGTWVAPLDLSPADWPGFRGPARDSRAEGPPVPPDWTGAPPRERWRIRVGPGWSSFAHVAGRLFTQEQRGDREAVVCYDADTGDEIWRHLYEARFTDLVAGPGPRATPTYANGRVYAMGATAVLSCLDAATGEPAWSRDLVREVDAATPPWGFAGSPLVARGRVIVYAGGRDEHGLVAYDAGTGAPAWQVGGRGINFTSAQPVTIAGVELALFTNAAGLLAVDPASGDVSWEFTPVGWRGPPMIQPQHIGDGAVLVCLGDGVGVARLDVARGDDGAWQVTERWSSRRIKASFNDFVHHEGSLYGFDKSIFACLDVETGATRWRKGRYGFGQVLLLAASGTLVVTGESGEVVLLAADPAGPRELGRVGALSGKTWNHPVVVGDRLFVRNGEEAVCYELGADADG
ncbi:MAG: PQQ-binding-like beta-propeller repeat protein [Planctomycetota bacterium]|jgi:outer membrane protein assembly factor BamB